MESKFKAWCKVELFGHTVLIGEVSDYAIGGETFIRVDVPERKDTPAFTKFFGKGAIYALSPISKDVAMALVDRYTLPPVTSYELRQALISQQETPADVEVANEDEIF